MKIAFVLIFAACGKPTANTCATRSASYLAHFTQQDGNCGPVPDQVVNISADGEIAGAAGVSCEKSEAVGCTQNTTNCRNTVDGVTCSSTASLTFTKDGASASGTSSVTCTGAATCAGSYRLSYTRQ